MTEVNGEVKKVKKTKNQIRREKAKAKRVAVEADKSESTVEETEVGKTELTVEATEAAETESTVEETEVGKTESTVEGTEVGKTESTEAGKTESTEAGKTESVETPSQSTTEPTEPRKLSSLSNIFDSEIDQSLNDPRFAQYKLIFNKFYTEANVEDSPNDNNDGQGQIFYSDDEGAAAVSDDSDNENENSAKLTKKKLKQLKKIPLALLKSHSKFPEIVEWYDADADDADLLIQLKSSKGVVQIPDHWLLKREFLSSKRGIMRQPFELPGFIKDTGIMDMRDSLKEDESTLKQKTRERVQPKMGKLDIDYQKLHNAFFKFQTKPRLFGVGDIYYEGKENQIDFSKYRPGKLSSRLKNALNIPAGAPPPWLLNMQRHGPPPSYNGLRIPGLNSPLPSGAQWGFQPGGWGRTPVDGKGAPLYGGDLYGLVEGGNSKAINKLAIPAEKKSWGAMVSDEEEEEEEEEGESEEDEEDEDEEEDDDQGQGYVDEDAAKAEEEREAAVETTTTGDFELRKSKRSTRKEEDEDEPTVVSNDHEHERDSSPKRLFHVLEQSDPSSTQATGFMGTQKTYNIPTATNQQRKRRRFEEPTEQERQEFEKSLDNLLETEKTKAELAHK